MAIGANVITIWNLFALKSLCLSHFGKFVHVIRLFFLLQLSYKVVFVYFIFERLLHRTGPSYVGPVRCSSRLPNFSQFVLAEGDGRWSIE